MPNKVSTIKKIPNWIVAALDQLSFSLITFLTTMILSRLMSIESFSEFSIAFSIFLFGALLHQSLVIDPMLMAAKKSRRFFYHFLLVSVGVSFVCSLVCMAALSIFLVQQPSFAFFIFTWVMLNLYFVRRSLIVLGRLYISAVIGFVALILQVVLLLYFGGSISNDASVAYYLLAFPGVFSIILMIFWVGIWFEFDKRLLLVCVSKSIYSGRWIGLGSFLAWPITNIYYFILPVYAGLDSVSEFKLLFTMMMPATQLVTALCVFCLPRMSRLKDDVVGFRVFFKKVLVFSFFASFLYSVVCAFVVVEFGSRIWSGLYEFSYVDLLATSVFMLTMNFVSVSLLLLKSVGETKSIFSGSALVLILTLFFSNGFVCFYGVLGAFVSLSISFLLLGVYFFRSSGFRYNGN